MKTFERVTQTTFRINGARETKVKQSAFPWHQIFACGYGAGIRVQGTSTYDYYLAVDAVYPLFRYDVPLQNPELVVRRLIDEPRIMPSVNSRVAKQRTEKILESFRELLAHVLQLHSATEISLTRTGIMLETRRGRINLSSLGDGYRATVTWVLDLLSWWFLRRQRAVITGSPTKVSGIVLIDEIEQHLHPRWQRNIMRLLTEAFPDVQFIATTHSPLVASGCEAIAVHRLNQGEHDVIQPFGWLAEDVYEMMGVASSRAKTFIDDVLERYERLDEKRLRTSLSKQEKRQLIELREKFHGLPGSDPIRLTTELENLKRRVRQAKRAQ